MYSAIIIYNIFYLEIGMIDFQKKDEYLFNEDVCVNFVRIFWVNFEKSDQEMVLEYPKIWKRRRSTNNIEWAKMIIKKQTIQFDDILHVVNASLVCRSFAL